MLPIVKVFHADNRWAVAETSTPGKEGRASGEDADAYRFACRVASHPRLDPHDGRLLWFVDGRALLLLLLGHLEGEEHPSLGAVRHDETDLRAERMAPSARQMGQGLAWHASVWHFPDGVLMNAHDTTSPVESVSAP